MLTLAYRKFRSRLGHTLFPVLAGAGLGLLWGVAARIWMRLIAVRPEFTLAGTAGILVIAALFGAFAGLAYAARSRGWTGWRHYLARGLAVFFFLPFGMAGGLPLMLTVLTGTVGATRGAATGWWVIGSLALLLAAGTDIGVPLPLAAAALGGAAVLTFWKWMVTRRGGAGLRGADAWVERIGRAGLLLLAAYGLWTVAAEIVADKPGWQGPVYVLLYLVLLGPLFFGLRLGLAPAESR